MVLGRRQRGLWIAGAAALASSSSTAGRPLDVVANLAPAAIVHDANLPAIPSLQQHQLMPAVTSTSAFSAPASVQHPGQHPLAQLRVLLLLEASFVLLVDDADADDSSVRLLPDVGESATLLPLCLRWSFPFVPLGAEETTLIRVFKQSFLLAVTVATFVSSSEEEGFGRMIRIRSSALIDISNVLLLLLLLLGGIPGARSQFVAAAVIATAAAVVIAIVVFIVFQRRNVVFQRRNAGELTRDGAQSTAAAAGRVGMNVVGVAVVAAVVVIVIWQRRRCSRSCLSIEK